MNLLRKCRYGQFRCPGSCRIDWWKTRRAKLLLLLQHMIDIEVWWSSFDLEILRLLFLGPHRKLIDDRDLGLCLENNLLVR